MRTGAWTDVSGEQVVQSGDMVHTEQPSFDASEEAVLDEIGRYLRAEGWGRGWAIPLTVGWLLRNWQKTSERVAHYNLTIDDYMNDLTARDALEIVLAISAEPLRSKLKVYIETSDRQFIAGTEVDIGSVIARFYLIDESSGWWWKRKPKVGDLAQYLAEQGARKVLK